MYQVLGYNIKQISSRIFRESCFTGNKILVNSSRKGRNLCPFPDPFHTLIWPYIHADAQVNPKFL